MGMEMTAIARLVGLNETEVQEIINQVSLFESKHGSFGQDAKARTTD